MLNEKEGYTDCKHKDEYPNDPWQGEHYKSWLENRNADYHQNEGQYSSKDEIMHPEPAFHKAFTMVHCHDEESELNYKSLLILNRAADHLFQEVEEHMKQLHCFSLQ